MGARGEQTPYKRIILPCLMPTSQVPIPTPKSDSRAEISYSALPSRVLSRCPCCQPQLAPQCQCCTRLGSRACQTRERNCPCRTRWRQRWRWQRRWWSRAWRRWQAGVTMAAAGVIMAVGVTMAAAASPWRWPWPSQLRPSQMYGHRNYGYRGYRGGRWYGGRWWGYGVGTCWQWTPSGYIWICGY